MKELNPTPDLTIENCLGRACIRRAGGLLGNTIRAVRTDLGKRIFTTSIAKIAAPKIGSASWLAAALLFAALQGSSAFLARAQSTIPAHPATSQPSAGAPKAGHAEPATPPLARANSRNQALIDTVEHAYEDGVANYRAGHLEAARNGFDYAVDLMLTSGLDLKTDPQLSEEFERIVDAVNALEMDALKEGNGFAPRTEPAPVDIANDVTFPVDPAVRAQAEAQLKTTKSDLPLVLNDYVASYINFFSNASRGHGTIVNSLRRAGRYKDLIQSVLKQEGVPQDLIYQAVAESGFQTQALNARSGAAGMWQFMPFANSYGLTRNGWVDERFDPEKATHAYARYIKMLYNQFGDWYLAMAAYDWGAGNVQRAVQRTGYADFWELYRRNALPAETKNYVPIILAATIMAKNPKQYGLDTMVADPPVLSDTVTTNYSIDLRLVADVTEVPVQEITGLNPSLLRMTTPSDPFQLHVPAGKGNLFQQRVAEVPEDKRRSWRFHKVAEGETLDDVARSFHVRASDIAFVNQIGENADLSDTDSLVVPVAPPSASGGTHATLYRAQRGDTLVKVADRFGVTVDQLRRWNHLKAGAIQPGRRLFVAEPAHITRASRGGRRGRPPSFRGSSGRRSSASSRKSGGSATSPVKGNHSSTSRPQSKSRSHR